MACRILHCGKSLENYYLCLQHKVVGFLARGASQGDVIYLAVKVGKNTYCGARGTLGEITDFRPWQDGDIYVHCLQLLDLEFCKPFELKILADIGGKYWPVKYLQMAKAIKDAAATDLLDDTFRLNKQVTLWKFPSQADINSLLEDDNLYEDEGISEQSDIQDSYEEIVALVPDAGIRIMGTFQTVSFYNETDKIRGLEKLVNDNFYALFPHYIETKTLLISDNRMFLTEGVESESQEFVTGIRTIPDALLISFKGKSQAPIQINLIEYECYGEQKTRTLEKSNYLNGHIIPQLMRFASAFSVVTDRQIRERTAKRWAKKIIDYIYNDLSLQNRVTAWMRELYPNLGEQRIALEIQELLMDAFKTNIQVILIIDELSTEQKSTITNVVKAFKLENGSNVNFVGYVVRLEQRIQIVDGDAEYALSVQ